MSRKTLQQYTENEVDAIDPQAKSLFDELLTKIEAEIDGFHNQLKQLFATSVKNAAQAAIDHNKTTVGKTLPWFKHGARGFLRKLWYGNHPNNPDWQNESSLGFYAYLSEQVDGMTDVLLNELTGIDLSPIIQPFKSRLTRILQIYLGKANKLGLIGKKIEPTPASKQEPKLTPAPKQEPEPEPESPAPKQEPESKVDSPRLEPIEGTPVDQSGPQTLTKPKAKSRSRKKKQEGSPMKENQMSADDIINKIAAGWVENKKFIPSYDSHYPTLKALNLVETMDTQAKQDFYKMMLEQGLSIPEIIKDNHENKVEFYKKLLKS